MDEEVVGESRVGLREEGEQGGVGVVMEGGTWRDVRGD